MNDPHVIALIYRVEHGPGVDYDKAEPLEHEEPRFRVRVENGRARFEMKEHYARADEARAAVEPFLQAWELDVGLESGAEAFRLVYENAETIDRNPSPSPGKVHAVVADVTMAISGKAKVVVGRANYPSPPSALVVSPDVRSMYDRYCGYRQGREPLASMAYFCLTVLETSAGGRRAAANRYGIDMEVRDKLGNLTAEKGGREARKAGGSVDDFSAQEVRWIEETVKAIIRRAAEVAHDPSRTLDQITLANLPDL